VSFFFRQWLAGRDFAHGDAGATQMANFVYVLGDAVKRECVLVDPAWDIDGLLRNLDEADLRLTGVLATHYHPDHVGGDLFGFRITGLRELIAQRPVPIHVHTAEAHGVHVVTGLSARDLIGHAGSDILKVGDLPIEFVHTPGHTPGSLCFLVDGKLISGDTLFVGGCGRVDLPGGDPEEMYRTLTQRLARLPDEIEVFPGHDYADRPSSTLGIERRDNVSMRVHSRDEWLRFMS
jgi:glyoxylase-like metal-dependent hydrolase (beta-lactamase superfamily II)